MERRDLLKTVGAFTTAALVPHDAIARCARVASGLSAGPVLNDAQLSLIGAIADTLIPRTATPGALDVGVPAFVNTLVTESYPIEARRTFTAGLGLVEAYLRDGRGRSFLDLDAPSRGARIADIEDHGFVYRAASKLLRHGEPQRTYWQLKELIVHGYFTSEIVAKDILREKVMPGAFDGAAPFSPKTNTTAARERGHA
jgi:gluconate 2-dehydrogenase gamma chain